MLKFISAIIFLLWSIFIIYLYYTKNTSHLGLIAGGNSAYLFLLVAIILALYGGFKFWQLSTEKKEFSYNFWTIIGSFLIIFLVICLFYANAISTKNAISWVDPSGFVLFFHAITLLIYPIFLVFLWKAIGGSLFHFSENWKNLPTRLTALTETTLGLGIFSLIVFLLGFFGKFQFAPFIASLIILTFASFFGWKKIFAEISTKKITLNTSGTFTFHTFTAEISFLIFSFVASVSLVNAIRPMPIGWDDLGVYMNFPKIIANTGTLLEGAGMYIWHLITSTGFIWNNNASQAFYVNQIGGFLATIAIICGLSLLLDNKNPHKKTIVSLPAILGIVYYIMPMTIFQQAKDMKLDPALMFVSVTAVMTIFYAFSIFSEKKKFAKILFFIAGIIVGIAFGIKFTTLMLIIAIFSIIAYKILGISGFFGFFWAFVAIFTKWNLWSELFVWMPENSNSIVIFASFLSIISFGFAFYKFREKFVQYLSISVIFGFWILLAILPWTIKNFAEIRAAGNSFSISGILNGAGNWLDEKWNGIFFTDYSKIYSSEEIAERKAKNEGIEITGSGTSMNEDLNRYFGQETGLNNYIKLPANLTFQINQKGEFTDITYIFLAFVPVALLFANTKNRRNGIIWTASIMIFLIFATLTFVHILMPNSLPTFILSQFFAKISLPWAYGALIILIGIFVILAHFLLDDEKNENLKTVIFLLAIYGFIFWISAFGIVWYGVLIYFLLLAVIALSLDEINTYSKNEESVYVNSWKINTIFSLSILGFPPSHMDSYSENQISLHFKKTIIGIFVILISIYPIFSALSHSFKNLASADYDMFKYNTVSQDSAIFLYKSDYLKNLIELNIADKSTVAAETIAEIEKSSIKNLAVQMNETTKNDISAIQGILQSAFLQILNTKASITNTKKLAETRLLKEEIQKILDNLYKKILYPSEEIRNNKAIYRIGTFMAYFIQNNRARFYEDSLVTQFQSMFYDENSDITIDRAKKLWLEYFLIDLNAATIDRDARHALTTRYENLLLTMRNSRLSLIDTDNVCLRMAIDEYHDGKLQNNREFLDIAGTNYISYTDTGAIAGSQKLLNCINYMVKNNLFEKYDYLASYMPTGNTVEEMQKSLISNFPRQTYFALFRID